ncbi:rab guanine nucleotide exchange factor sec2 [Acrodontium crateriforme]|uniref:Rab guanine nucleotide exchange factor sec2 n=1 Tax=Acrodontium crateriforme TaxID=150365 RepID=A0AAQ3M5L8_9PEZI|nr:rab guanine nucleotide exchange factor sec2 [Acrodontium crateriforme]
MRSSSTPPQIKEPPDMATTIAMRNENVMDTRTPSPVGRTSTPEEGSDKYKPDLSAEVAMLSTKLVNAINYQTNLDDSLQQARHELEQARKELARVQAEKKELDDQVASGALIQKSSIDRTMAQLRADVIMERTAREAADKAKKETEGELENLTTALFQEANTMVASARKDTEAVERRNSQLRSQLNDTELLLASQQEQLRDLKDTMERMERSSEYESTGQRESASIPSTPITANFDALNLSPSAGSATDIPPEHPLHFSHLLAPILRQDVAAYGEFQELITIGGRITPVPHSRSTSNNHNIASSSQTNLNAGIIASSPNVPGAFSFSANSSPQSVNFPQSGPPLKESKFYKRVLIEDLEPTLRLDLAPGLNLFSRRTVLSALLQGGLVVEPFLPSTKVYGPIFSCALCGESRKNEPYLRKHRFRTSEEDSAQRYPLCDYCLNRVRASGDFVGFLRMIRDGHWKAESAEEQKSAWEESVRLRERMFWARLGGGVVPVHQPQRREITETPSTAAMKSARPSLESVPEASPEAKMTNLKRPALKTPSPGGAEDSEDARNDSSQESESDQERPSSVVIVSAPKPNMRSSRDYSSHRLTALGPSINLSSPEKQSTSQQSSTEEDKESPSSSEDAKPVDHTSKTTSDEDEFTASLEDAPTPFEDAQSEIRELSSSPKPENVSAARSIDTANKSVAESTATSIPKAKSPPVITSRASGGLTPPLRSKASFDALSTKAERRPSGVLARVRAMEAQAQTRPAGGVLGKRTTGSFD